MILLVHVSWCRLFVCRSRSRSRSGLLWSHLLLFGCSAALPASSPCTLYIYCIRLLNCVFFAPFRTSAQAQKKVCQRGVRAKVHCHVSISARASRAAALDTFASEIRLSGVYLCDFILILPALFRSHSHFGVRLSHSGLVLLFLPLVRLCAGSAMLSPPPLPCTFLPFQSFRVIKLIVQSSFHLATISFNIVVRHSPIFILFPLHCFRSHSIQFYYLFAISTRALGWAEM